MQVTAKTLYMGIKFHQQHHRLVMSDPHLYSSPALYRAMGLLRNDLGESRA